ncbi:DUF202 domain-containing protein [Kribbella sp. NPDC000426]|uniref:YidH family protein n=1 Tax=Kribbella sp. NPDC000426 TaxID=3154255 RepID=UPI00331F47E3
MTASAERVRFPRRVFAAGNEPDPRFTLANERTFLAWTRTALALTAGGVALESLGLDLQPGFRLAASLVLIGTGTLTPPLAWREWTKTERALRESRPLPGAHLGVALGITVSVVGALVACAVVLR